MLFPFIGGAAVATVLLTKQGRGILKTAKDKGLKKFSEMKQKVEDYLDRYEG